MKKIFIFAILSIMLCALGFSQVQSQSTVNDTTAIIAIAPGVPPFLGVFYYIRNDGTGTATNIEADIDLLDELTKLQITAREGTFNESTGLWTIPSIEPGQSARLAAYYYYPQSLLSYIGTDLDILTPDDNPMNNSQSILFTLDNQRVYTVYAD